MPKVVAADVRMNKIVDQCINDPCNFVFLRGAGFSVPRLIPDFAPYATEQFVKPLAYLQNATNLSSLATVSAHTRPRNILVAAPRALTRIARSCPQVASAAKLANVPVFNG